MAYDLPKKILGRTGLEVTRLGIGGAYCETVEGYQQAMDSGVNYIDTARAYRGGEDEKVIGEALVGRRQDFILASKTGARDADGARRDLETSLRLLKTDCIDIYQLHHLNTAPERQQALGPDGALEAVLKAREQGLIRYIGVTGHDWPQIQQAVDTGVFDTVLCWYNCAMQEAEESVFIAAEDHDTGVVIMNAGRNDRLFNGPDAPVPEQFYRYVLDHQRVALTIMGLRDVARFVHVAAALADDVGIAPDEKATLEAYGKKRRAAGDLD
jgi:hypothetical protein